MVKGVSASFFFSKSSRSRTGAHDLELHRGPAKQRLRGFVFSVLGWRSLFGFSFFNGNVWNGRYESKCSSVSDCTIDLIWFLHAIYIFKKKHLSLRDPFFF